MKKEERIIKLQKRILLAGIITIYIGLAYIIWLSLQLKGIVG